MGLLGRLTGWDQQKEAHNAVAASHLAQSASPELRREIVNRLVLIQQRVRGSATGATRAILLDLSLQPRIVQTNFIALACNSLGIPPALRGQTFAEVVNPYGANNESALSRIEVALVDLSRRSGERLAWPGNNVRIDFLSWAESPTESNSAPFRKPDPLAVADPDRAATLAFDRLLSGIIDLEMVRTVAADLVNAIRPQTNEELALATALFFYQEKQLRSHLQGGQMLARLSMVEWLDAGTIPPSAGKLFEDELYRIYRG